MSSDENLSSTLAKIKNTLLVMSGKGGVGKSTVAANIAVMLSEKNYKVGLLDIDFHGPSIAKLLGLTGFKLNTIENKIQPHSYNQNLKVITMQCLLDDPDSSVIWRGPMKIGVINQLISEVNWEELDYLIIDSPPGTGDEPLTIAQTIPSAKAVIVTTPQEVALADVRKSLHFCSQLNIEILGIIENMSYFVCPDCGSQHAIFKTAGGNKLAEDYQVPFLGSLPLEMEAVAAGDEGRPICSNSQSNICENMKVIIAKIIANTTDKTKGESKVMKVGIPVVNDKLATHFGHCQLFAIVTVEDNKIIKTETMVPPPHEPGVIPAWLAEQGVSLVLAGGMGQNAQNIFAQKGIKVVCGAPSELPTNVVNKYLSGKLEVGANACDH